MDANAVKMSSAPSSNPGTLGVTASVNRLVVRPLVRRTSHHIFFKIKKEARQHKHGLERASVREKNAGGKEGARKIIKSKKKEKKKRRKITRKKRETMMMNVMPRTRAQ